MVYIYSFEIVWRCEMNHLFVYVFAKLCLFLGVVSFFF